MKTITSLLLAVLAAVPASRGCQTADLIAALNSNGGNPPPIILGRPLAQIDWATPDGRFRIHFDITGEKAVYHAEEDVAPADGIPDYVNRTADFLALAYDSLVLGLGFDPPPSDGEEGGDPLYDIYLTDVLGLTTPEYPSDQYPGRPAYTSYIQLGHDMRIWRYPDDPYPFLKASAAHEFFHAVEFAYRAFSEDITPWWFESCANWAEEKVFDDLNDVYYYLSNYLASPHESLYRTNGPFIYGAWLFPEYLDERFGDDIIKICWEKFASFDFSIDAVSVALTQIGADFNSEYGVHVIWDYFTGSNYQPGFYSEAAEFDTTVFVARTHYSLPVDWVSQPVRPENLGSSYIVFRHSDYAKGSLVIEYINPTENSQAVGIAVVIPGAPVEYQIYDVDSGIPSTFTIPEFARTEKVVMMPVWLYEGEPRDGATAYSYRAYLDSAITAVAGDDSGRPLQYSLKSAYPNPFNSSIVISFDSPFSESYAFRVYDLSGRLLYGREGVSRPGTNMITWHASDGIASGLLFYSIDFAGARLDGKMSFLK